MISSSHFPSSFCLNSEGTSESIPNLLNSPRARKRGTRRGLSYGKSACITVAAELTAADQSEGGHIQLPGSQCRQNLELTVHNDMVSFPEELLVLERRLQDGRGVFPIRPVRPVLPEVDAVPQLLGSERAVGEHEIIAALGERGRVVVRVREHHNVVLLALSEEEVVGSLIVQAR